MRQEASSEAGRCFFANCSESYERLTKETKTELMVQILNTYSGLIRNKMNEKLADHHIGKHLNVGEVSIVERDDVLYLWIGQVRADYRLVSELMPGRLGFFGGLAGALMGENLEEQALKLLWNEERKQSALILARNTEFLPAESLRTLSAQ